MRRSVEQLDHTEEFKQAVEGCKKDAKPGTNCFAVISKKFRDAGKPIFKNKGNESKHIEQGLIEKRVRIYAEIGS